MLRVLTAALTFAAILALNVTIRNDIHRTDTDGNIIDCHSGNIVAVNGTFYMYGEKYDNVSGVGPSPPLLRPRIVVYTSSDLVTWTNKGEVFSTWPNYPYGTFFTPWAVYDKIRNRFVLWFNAYVHGCCEGNWGVATSDDGLHFTVLSMNVSGTYASVDCNSILMDDDGTGYLLYTSEAEDHTHSIQLLSEDYTNTTGTNYGLFGPSYTEGGVLFKEGDLYHFGAGSCCCFCRNGSGWVHYTSPSISGPWTRQAYDLNCNSSDPAAICGGYGERADDPIRINAQGIGMSHIPLANGGTAHIWHGDRFLTAPYASPTCPDECQAQVPPLCGQDPRYIKGHMFDYWKVLVIHSDGSIEAFEPFVDSFTLDIAVGFGTDHLQPRDKQVVERKRAAWAAAQAHAGPPTAQQIVHAAPAVSEDAIPQ